MTPTTPSATDKPFRILSLDGGGIMGAFAASALATFERETGKRCVDHFDLVAGTSTGGIIAIALAMGAKAEEILKFYREDGPKIFPTESSGGWIAEAKAVFGPRYGSEALRASVSKVVGDRTLAEARTRLVVPSFDINTGKIYVFKTPHHRNARANRNTRAIDVALATSAAPTFFPAHTIPDRGTFIDGGLWANCPAMVALTEALDFLGREPKNIKLLSVGTTNYPFRIDDPEKLRGAKDWLPHLVDTFMFGQAQAAVNMAFCLLKPGRFHRIDYDVPPDTFKMNKADDVEHLIRMGRQIADLNENFQVVEREFLNGDPIEPFAPPAQS